MRVLFYIITCNNPDCQLFYIGKTNDIINRMRVHQHFCTKLPEQKLYKVINNNGGWKNWSYNIIDDGEFNDEPASLIRECEIYDLLQPSLNSMRPIRLPLDNPIHKIKARDAVRRFRAKNK